MLLQRLLLSFDALPVSLFDAGVVERGRGDSGPNRFFHNQSVSLKLVNSCFLDLVERIVVVLTAILLIFAFPALLFIGKLSIFDHFLSAIVYMPVLMNRRQLYAIFIKDPNLFEIDSGYFQ